MDTCDIWIEKGYAHFGEYGPKDLSIKLIAEECSMARTTFNYHFSNKEEFCDELIDRHYELLDQYCELAGLHCKTYLPDVHKLALMFPQGFKFQKQLFNYRHIPKFNKVYEDCNRIAGEKFSVQLFIDYYKLPLSFDSATQLHNSLVDTWYSRLDVNNMTLDNMVRSSEEIMRSILKLIAQIRDDLATSDISFSSGF